MENRYRFANEVEGDYEQKRIEADYFKGYVCCIRIKNTKKPLIVNNGINEICIKNEDYTWVEAYPDDAKYAITVVFDDQDILVEWYFDIARGIGLKEGIPFEDDLYLDMVITPEGKNRVLDEDELIIAFKNGKITQDDVEEAYQTLRDLENKYVFKFEDLKKLTNVLCEMFGINTSV